LLSAQGSDKIHSKMLAMLRWKRETLFLALLSDKGLAWLKELLASRRYKIKRPEDAALPVVAWLIENGRVNDAALVVAEISQYASELRFMPEAAPEPVQNTELVHRFSSNDARRRLLNYGSNSRIETQREALSVWIPFMDRLVAHWLELIDDDDFTRHKKVASENWRETASALLDEYETLKIKHTLCRKYHNKKENLLILITATRDFLSHERPSRANLSGRVPYAVACYVKAHGRPGEARLTALREGQARIASLPPHKIIAETIADRLPKSDDGLTNAEELLSPPPLNAPVPKRVCNIVRGALKASLPELIKRGIVPSAEVMAELIPQLTASEISRSYADENLGLLIAEAYKAFCRRRSLLLLNLASQVRFNELPWIKAVQNECQNTGYHAAVALRLAAHAVDYFPGVILPNPLVEQLNALYGFAGKKRIFVEELAADIFMGRFAQKFDDATLTAATMLRGTLYEKYYDLDYADFEERVAGARLPRVLSAKTMLEQAVKKHVDESPNFVVRNGMLLERAQIYTTHNLATLVAEGVKFERSYEELSFMAFEQALRLIARGRKLNNLGYRHNCLRAIKNAAYAWRQAIFFLSISPEITIDALICRAEKLSLDMFGESTNRELFERLKTASRGERPMENQHIFLGWTSGSHWLAG